MPAAPLANAIAILVVGGNCSFADKARNAQRAGYVGALIYNTDQRDRVVVSTGGTLLSCCSLVFWDSFGFYQVHTFVFCAS